MGNDCLTLPMSSLHTTSDNHLQSMTSSIHIFQTDVRCAWNVDNNLPKVSPTGQQ